MIIYPDTFTERLTSASVDSYANRSFAFTSFPQCYLGNKYGPVRCTACYVLVQDSPLSIPVSILGDSQVSFKLKGDIIIGGLFPVHRRSKTTENKCAALDPHPGYQYLASMLFALEEINNDPILLPNITIGTEIYDTCRSQTIGADGAKEIIRYTLKATNTTPPLAGVIGPFRSDVSVAVANLFRVFNIPQVSYGSTTTELSNKQIYGYFLRTVPPNSFQSKAMVDVVKRFCWTYVLTVYSPGKYGEKGMEIFYEEAEKAKLCIAKKIKLPAFPTDKDFQNTIRKLVETRKANGKGELGVVVLFCIQRDNEGLVRAAKKEGQRFSWIASNSWGDRMQVTRGSEEAGEGAITMNYIEGKVERFRQYLLSRNPSNNQHGVWFDEFWQSVLKCSLKNSKKPLDFERKCEPNETLPRNLEIAPVRVVMNAVYAMAHALNDMHTELCSGGGMCARMQELKREDVLRYLKNVSFPDVSLNFTVRFNRNGEVDGNYSVLNFQKVGAEYRHVKVGSWGGVLMADEIIEGGLVINQSEITWTGGDTKVPQSYCSKSCAAKQIKIPELTNPRCCWRCDDCESKEIITNGSCQRCPQGYQPDNNLVTCNKLPVVYPTWGDTAAIVVASLAGVGSLVTFATAAFFIAQRNHRVIKAAGRELCVILFAGVLLCYVAALLYFIKPGIEVCTVRRFTTSMSMTMCYAPVLLRTNRIYRIFKAAQASVTRPSFVSPISQLFVAFGMIGVQALIILVWILSDKPSILENYQYDNRTLLECQLKDTHVAINLCYNIFLMLISTVYAFKTRNFPRNFNEAKHIGITMYLSCSVWVIFLPCYLNAQDGIWKNYFVCFALVLIGTTTLLGLLVPKIFLVIFSNAVSHSETMNTGTFHERPAANYTSSQLRELPKE